MLSGACLHYKDVPKETMFERSIEERIKLRKENLMKLKEKNRTETMNCLKNSPSNMYEELSETEGAVNKVCSLFVYSLYRSKKLKKISIRVWLALFKHGKNLYEH